jgi:acyl-coenzyme A thioesterase PaaI-like protein
MPVGVRYGPANPLERPPAPLAEHLGLRCVPGSNAAELDVVGDAVNPLGILHGGLLSLLAIASARAGSSEPGSMRITDVVLRFVGSLPQDRVARATADVHPAGADAWAARVAITDPFDEQSRIGALASVGLAPA